MKLLLASQSSGRAAMLRAAGLTFETSAAHVDEEKVEREIAFARRMFADNGWPVIDVTRRSIEETAAAIIRQMNERAAAVDGPVGIKPI